MDIGGCEFECFHRKAEVLLYSIAWLWRLHTQPVFVCNCTFTGDKIYSFLSLNLQWDQIEYLCFGHRACILHDLYLTPLNIAGICSVLEALLKYASCRADRGRAD